MTRSYRLPLTDLFLHPLSSGWLVRDQAEPIDQTKLELIAQIRSGDYFELLATKLDDISRGLAAHNYDGYERLEAAIKDLLYLQKNYQITKK